MAKYAKMSIQEQHAVAQQLFFTGPAFEYCEDLKEPVVLIPVEISGKNEVDLIIQTNHGFESTIEILERAIEYMKIGQDQENKRKSAEFN